MKDLKTVLIDQCHLTRKINNLINRGNLRILTGKKTPSNKTPALRKSTNMGVSAIGTLNQLFIRGS